MSLKNQNSKLYTKAVALIGVLAFYILPLPTYAQLLEVGIGTEDQVDGLIEYIVLVYQFVVAIVGILAVVMIMFAGLKWAAAAGNQSMIGDAKERIKEAFAGLAIALGSYIILILINPYLVSFQNLEIQQLEFDQAFTTDLGVMTSGEICDDPTIISYNESLPENLKEHMVSYASVPCIKESIYTMLVNVLTDLDNAEPSDPYYGMTLTINGANRTYAQMQLYWDCYYNYGKQGLPCPDACRASNCSVAANPEKGKGSNHSLGLALDVSSNWVGANASSSYHKSCVVTGGVGSGCSTEIYENILILDQLMQDNGFARLCIEWWHYELPGIDAECPVGDYR